MVKGGKRNRSKSPAKPQEEKEASEPIGEKAAEPMIEKASEPMVEKEEIPAKAAAEAEADEETPKFVSDGKYKNKQRCLVLCLRGATARYRHLLEDLRTLLPHHKKESKLDPGKGGMARAVNDIAEIRSCNSVLYLECRKHQDAYMWMGRTGENAGPSAKFHVSNVHTMDELRLTGNCMKSSRPILTFDESFKRFDHLKLLKELFVDIFGTPRGHPKSKPFVDRVMAFYYADNKVRPLSF
jgi:ribosome biogenesis protein BRX1